MALFTLIFKSLRHDRGLYGLWILSLSLAVTGLLVVDIFRQSLTATLTEQGQNILSADLAVSSRQEFRAEERAELQSAVPGQLSEMTEMLAMASTGPNSRLVNVHFVDDRYPLYGQLILSDGRVGLGSELGLHPELFVAADLLPLLHVHLGDAIHLGQQEFTISGVIAKDPSQTLRFGQMAPRVYAHRKFLDQTHLMQFGTTASRSLLLRTPQPVPGLKQKIEKIFSDPQVQVTTPRDLEQGPFRIMSRLFDFLGLIGLITLALGWTGIYYLGRRWLILESTVSGQLKSLGLSDRNVARLLVAKLAFILLFGVLIGGALAWILAHFLSPLLQEALPTELVLTWSWTSALLLLIVGPGLGVTLLWPVLAALSEASPLTLLQGVSPRARPKVVFSFATLNLLLFFLLTLAQAHSWRVSLIFLGALVATVALVSAFGYVFIRFGAHLRSRLNRGWKIQTVLGLWSQRRAISILIIIVSALSGLLAQLIPTLEKTLVGELQSPASSDRPALFLFDIQDEQLTPLKELLHGQKIELHEISPFIRGRILQVNGENFERGESHRFATREEELDARMRNRGVNLSYREKLSFYEEIVEGKAWSEMDHNPDHADVSVEEGYAKRMKLNIGDKLTFDVGGVEVHGQVASLRKVDRDSFEPNFFILFPAGILDPAPKTWIVTIRSTTNRTPAEIQNLIHSDFPNVTSIDVQETLTNLLALMDKLGRGLRIASGLCLALGIFVILLILTFQLASSRRDRLLLKILGVRDVDVLILDLFTYGGLCFFGLFIGSVCSLLVAATLARFAFDSTLQVDWQRLVEVFLLTLMFALMAMTLLNWRLAHEKIEIPGAGD